MSNILNIRDEDGVFRSIPTIIGPKGDPGPGLPSGGSSGQVLIKQGSEDYVAGWGPNNASLLDDREPMYYKTYPQILDNSTFDSHYFLKKSTTGKYLAGTTKPYIAPRWYASTTLIDPVFDTDHIVVNAYDASSYIYQSLPLEQVAGKRVSMTLTVTGQGQNIRFGVFLQKIDGLYALSSTVTLSDGVTNIVAVGGLLSSDGTDYQFRIYPDYSNPAGSTKTLAIHHAAVYIGQINVTTVLDYPTYIPKDKGVDLANCSRYYQEIGEYVWRAPGALDVTISFSPMRITPTPTIISMNGTVGKVSKLEDDAWIDVEGTVTCSCPSNSTLRIYYANFENTTDYQEVFGVSKIILNAEL